MNCELGIGPEFPMSRKEAFVHLNEQLSSPANPELQFSGAAEPQQPAQQPGHGNTAPLPRTKRSWIKDHLDRLESTTVETLTNMDAHFAQIKGQLSRLEEKLTEFVANVKDAGDEERTHYTPREFAERLMREGVKKFKGKSKGGARRVQQWCRDKRLKAQHRPSGLGEHGEWMIPHDEYVRYKNHGLLPLPKN
jgi:hypothetical protein